MLPRRNIDQSFEIPDQTLYTDISTKTQDPAYFPIFQVDEYHDVTYLQ